MNIIATRLIVLIIMLGSAVNAFGWEVKYDASLGLLPSETSQPWKPVIKGTNLSSVSDGILNIRNNLNSSYYNREVWAINAGVPVTMEARMRLDASSIGSTKLSIQTKGCYINLDVYTDRIGGRNSYYSDFTTFHTIRLAYDGANHAYVWVNNKFALSWSLTGAAGQNGISFGTDDSNGPYDSYWQYVAYSKEYLPVPEPSSLLTLLGGIAGLGGLAMRRRR